MKPPARLTLEMAERIIADAVMVNLALITAFTLRFLSFFMFGEEARDPLFYSALFQNFVRAYRDLGWLLTLICLVIFYLIGFYTYGRAYRSRYKALLVFQGVSLSYLIFGFLAYFIQGSTPFPRSVLILAWLLTLILVGGLRIGAALFRRTVWAEAKIWGMPQKRTINKRTINNILVIGGAGYIGSVLVRKLLGRGYYVTVLDVLLYGDESIRDLYGHDRFEFIRGDMRNVENVVRAMQFADAVVHLGALVGDPACALDEKLTLEINLAATRIIAEVAQGFGIQRFIFASTCSVYGASDQLLDEHSALNPVSLYARTKMESERVLLAMNNERFAPVILRLATVYGLSPRPRFDLVVNLLAAKATCEKRIIIFGGDQWRPFIHVDDAAEAIVRCLEAPLEAIKGQIFNVGSDEQNYQIRQLGDIIRQLIPDVEVVLQGEDVDKRNYRVSFGKIRKYLGFTPRRTVADGVLEIKAAIEDGRIRDYRDAHYSNLKTLSEESSATLIRRTRMTPLYAGGLEEVQPSAAPA
ncbi:NAD-dependent epimerase/dehydratase family protein, partial [Thermanaerothrix sp.]|uniref:NAD-dependent epimerase/dehydratase family protein n=1 Tax=Thermanaerothrix sp. TaxID=2972675 RepID=UPI003C798513